MGKSKTSSSVKPFLHKSIFQAIYKPTLDFYRHFISAAQQLNEYPHWQTTGLQITLFDWDLHNSVSLTHTSFSYHQDSEEVALESASIGRLIEVLPAALEIKSFKRFGLRRWYLAPVVMEFDELVSIVSMKLFSQDKKLLNLLPSQTKDLSYILVAADESLSYRIVAGPTKRAEIPNYIQIDGEHHFNVQDRAEAMLRIRHSYPEVSLFMDIDCFVEDEELKAEGAKQFIENAQKRIDELANNLVNYCFESKVK